MSKVSSKVLNSGCNIAILVDIAIYTPNHNDIEHLNVFIDFSKKLLIYWIQPIIATIISGSKYWSKFTNIGDHAGVKACVIILVHLIYFIFF